MENILPSVPAFVKRGHLSGPAPEVVEMPATINGGLMIAPGSVFHPAHVAPVSSDRPGTGNFGDGSHTASEPRVALV